MVAPVDPSRFEPVADTSEDPDSDSDFGILDTDAESGSEGEAEPDQHVIDRIKVC